MRTEFCIQKYNGTQGEVCRHLKIILPPPPPSPWYFMLLTVLMRWPRCCSCSVWLCGFYTTGASCFTVFQCSLSSPGAVARSEAWSLGMQAAPSSIPTSGTFFRGDLVMKTFLRPFSLFPWFKKSSCQLLAKECALSTGKLPRRLAREQCGKVNWPRPKWPIMCWRAVKQKSNQSKSLSSCFFSFFSIVITSLGELGAGLCASRAVVYLFYTC